MTDSPIMDLPDVAEYLKCSPSTIYRLMKKGKLPMFKLGRDWKANRESIEQWCKAQEQNGHSPSKDGTTSR